MKRIVIKIGTATLTKNGVPDKEYIKDIANQISLLKNEGKEVVVVSSGAIGAGCAELGINRKPRDIKLRQAAAGVGQSLLMQMYYDAFKKKDITIAQLLLTYDNFSDRKTYLNLKNSLETMLKLGVVPQRFNISSVTSPTS